MKKTIFILILILAVVYAALTIFSWGDDYGAERLLYDAVKASRKVIINPDVAPPGLVVSVANKFKKVVKKYPDAKITKRAHMALAEFYMVCKKYDESLSTLNSIIEAKYDDVPLMSKAHFFRATTFEKLDRWDSALDDYTILKDRYFTTSVGLLVPLYLGRCYARKGDTEDAVMAYKGAILFYEQLEINNRGKTLGFAASDLLRQAYMDIGKYEAAGMVVENTLYNYSIPLTFEKYLPLVETIYVQTLKRPSKAIEIYSNLIEKTENAEFKKFLQRKIDDLK